MSTPDANTPPPHNPFGLLRAILIGTALGFFAVLLIPYLLPLHKPPVAVAKVEAPAKQPEPPRTRPIKVSAAAVAPEAFKLNASVKVAEADRAAPAEPKERPAAASVAQPEPNEGADKADALPPVPPAPPESKEADKAPEPALVPAVTMKFPKTFSAEEMTAALQPLLSFKLSDSDVAAIKEAMSSRGDDARAAIKKISDPAGKAFAEWKRFRNASADFNETMAFRKAHPLFPEPVQDPGFEKALFLSDASSADVLKYYTNRTPLSGVGKASLGAALMEAGERERGLRLIKFVWSRYTLDPPLQERFLARFGSLLDDEDQLRRKALLEARARQKEDSGKSVAQAEGRGLKAAVRLRSKRAHARRGRHSRSARRSGRRRHGDIQELIIQKQAALEAGKASAFAITSLVERVRHRRTAKADEPEPKKADDKEDKSVSQAKAAENAFKLSKEMSGAPSTLLARLKSLRREGADDDVWSLLRSVDPDKADLADPEKWWDFRRGEVRRALNEDHPETAYAIAKTHGPLDDESRSEAEFLAGWVALRYLKEPHRAEPHFEAAHAIKGYARDEARAAYWLGRTKLELGARKEAEKYFQEAASRFYTFYGSLAKQALKRNAVCEFRAPPRPTKEAIAAFVNEDAFKALMIAKQLDMQPLVINYLLDLTRQLNDPQQMTLALELTERIAPLHVMVRAAKIALLRGFPVDAYAFPTLLPKFDSAGGNEKLEPALLNALTRQESDFHTGSVSHVGARGLMQLMPQTARLVASTYKQKYDVSRLISDPSYNVTLGSAFLSELISGYDGSYVLSLAAYNAGPGRIKQWIKDFGDPRNKSADPVDWIERIPFTETRAYVQRILESTQLYRCRFENGKAKSQIVEDLHRGRPGRLPDLEDVSGSGELEQTP